MEYHSPPFPYTAQPSSYYSSTSTQSFPYYSSQSTQSSPYYNSPPDYTPPSSRPSSSTDSPGNVSSAACSSSSIPDSKINIVHPYARLFAKKDDPKRRKIWNHALEKALFSPYELSTVGAPQRRRIYIASLEAHIDQLHDQMWRMGYSPVQTAALDPFTGLNSKTAKSMVAGLQYDASLGRVKLLELERANHDLERLLHGRQ